MIAENAYTPEIINQVVDYAFTEKVYGEQARREQVFAEVDGMSDIELHVLCSEFDALNKFAVKKHPKVEINRHFDKKTSQVWN